MRPGEIDMCGYCGKEFVRSGSDSSSSSNAIPCYVTGSDLDTRYRHLGEMHNFRKYAIFKKLNRAGHFRQHLRHMHGGANGKWTNRIYTELMPYRKAIDRFVKFSYIFHDTNISLPLLPNVLLPFD